MKVLKDKLPNTNLDVYRVENAPFDGAEAKLVAEGLAQLDRDESVGIDTVLAKARAILDRAPDVPPDPGDELPG